VIYLYIYICVMLLTMFLYAAYCQAKHKKIGQSEVHAIFWWPFYLPVFIIGGVIYTFNMLAKWFGRNYL